MLGEMGYEMAQSNAAYLLEDGAGEIFDRNGSLARALVGWRRSAHQGFSEARVKVGDYHYYGKLASVDLEAAAEE